MVNFLFQIYLIFMIWIMSTFYDFMKCETRYIDNISKMERVSRPFDKYTNYWGYLYLACSFTLFRAGECCF